jgi:hypothetical protein
MTVVAEGVQDSSTRSELADMGCDLVQGYEICKPVLARELELWIETYLVTNSSPPPSAHIHEKVPGNGQLKSSVLPYLVIRIFEVEGNREQRHCPAAG